MLVGYFGWSDGPKGGQLNLWMVEKDKLVDDAPVPVSVATPGPNPRVSTIISGDGKTVPPRYEHTNLIPGRYLVFAATGVRGKDGQWLPGVTVGRWVDVGPAARLDIDFTIDNAAAGGLEVKAAPGAHGKVMLVPAEEPGKKVPDDLFFTAVAPADKRVVKSVIDVGADRMGDAVGAGGVSLKIVPL